MAGGHRGKTTAGARARRAKGRHRAKSQPNIAHGWLGAGAITIGVGAALATGSGVAYADSPGPDASTTSSTSSASTDAKADAGPKTSRKDTSTRPSSTAHRPVRTRIPTHGATSPSSTSTPDTDPKPKPPTKVTAEAEPATESGPTTELTAPAPAPAPAPASKADKAVVAQPKTKPRSTATTSALVRHVAPDATTKTVTASPVTAVPAVSRAAVVDVIPAAAIPVAPPLPRDPVTGLLTEVAAAVNTLLYPNLAVPPTHPLHLLVIEVVRHIEVALGLPVVGAPRINTPDPVIGSNPPSAADGTPRFDDEVPTSYGDIGKWLREPGNQISDFGGQKLDGKSLLEPINVIIVDTTSGSEAEATAKLNAQLKAAGFPAQPIHSTGFLGSIDGVTYGQQPTGPLDAYSNNFFLLPDDHARAFGPGYVDGVGYVWTVAASRELFGLYGLAPTHTYLSYNAARDELAGQLIDGGATLVGILPLSNAVDSPTQTTGDHDGHAIVVQLKTPALQSV